MDDELIERLKELLEHFEMQDGEWPSIHVNTSDGWQWGIVDEDLSEILWDLHRIVNEEGDSDETAQ